MDVYKLKNNLAIKNPELAKQWHPSKNGGLTPNDVTYGSHRKVWWVCVKGHEREAVIKSRVNGRGCPYCSGRRVCADNCLQALNPELSKQWHPTKNRDLTPNDVTRGSHRKVWWRCKNGHEYIASVTNRSEGRGCPYCSGNRVCADNNLQSMNPDIAKQWHPTRNGGLRPNDVTTGSDKKVWWQCKKGHEWQAGIYNRVNGNGCPYCSGRRASADNCLQETHPELAK
ncbi:MAG: zinc-ribbon domain-containing protein [Treponema sp.]|nr:zinc-ribbon domain-containing protein [Treponema sp.]